ncbi:MULTISPECIES: hypothetical protein [unclassified Halorubrum]|uniref:hypothetical protein n=1 Tax=unclassified Halorubrum TaxID=2642239 RepID=UPI0013051D4C|nr:MULTISPECIES: hypothetical protein [unclassified Halorubrum]
MRIAFDCSCGAAIDATATDDEGMTEWVACDDCGAEFSVTVTLTRHPGERRAA